MGCATAAVYVDFYYFTRAYKCLSVTWKLAVRFLSSFRFACLKAINLCASPFSLTHPLIHSSHVCRLSVDIQLNEPWRITTQQWKCFYLTNRVMWLWCLWVAWQEEFVADFQWEAKSFQLHFLLSRKVFQLFPLTHAQSVWILERGKFRYKILLEHCEHATVVIGRRENSKASSKSTRPSSELKVFHFYWCHLMWKDKRKRRRRWKILLL